MKKIHAAGLKLKLIPVTGLFLLLPSFAHAHPGLPGHTHGFANGLAHPLTGLDHLCAMFAVGLWTMQRGGRTAWLIPAIFVMVMSLGGALGMAGIRVPFVEAGILASVLILGVLIAAAVRLPLGISGLLVGAFALFHGLAHGAEMPASASGLAYALGFLLATACLHVCGMGLGLLARKSDAANAVRYAGGAIAACGVYLCLT